MSGIFSRSGTTVDARQQELQREATQEAVAHAFKQAGLTLAGSAALILGAARFFPRFNKSLSVSSKTALIATPAFGVFFLSAEMKMNERKRAKAAEQRAARVEAGNAN